MTQIEKIERKGYSVTVSMQSGKMFATKNGRTIDAKNATQLLKKI